MWILGSGFQAPGRCREALAQGRQEIRRTWGQGQRARRGVRGKGWAQRASVRTGAPTLMRGSQAGFAEECDGGWFENDRRAKSRREETSEKVGRNPGGT